MEDVQNIKCVVIGSRQVGKTRMLNSYVTSPDSSPPGPFDNYNGIKVQLEDDGRLFQLELWDTNCEDHNKSIRRIYYENCDLVIVCYSVMDHNSFKAVKKKWIPEVKNCRPTAHRIIVGTKNDLRRDRVSLLRLDRIENEKPITVEDGEKMAKRTSAAKYLECSAITGEGLKEVFRAVIEIHKNPPKAKQGSCKIL